MPYVGQKPADIIATAVDTTTGKFSGVVDADAGITVDNITIDGTEIDLSSGDLTVDVAGNIFLNADGGDVRLVDGDTQFGVLQNNSTDFVIQSSVSDKDIIFRGNDASSGIEAMRLDMSDAGTAIFGHDLKVADNNNMQFGSGPDLMLSSDGTNGTIENQQSNGDIIFKGSDAGSTITALTLDMSSAGKAIFNSGLAIGGTGDANTLSDYEEGTWTPTIGGSGVAYGTQAGIYKKVGSMVFVYLQITINTIGSPATINEIQGLPFAPSISNQYMGIAYADTIKTAYFEIHGNFRSNSVIRIEGKTGSGDGQLSGMNWAQNNAGIYASGMYCTDS